MKQSQLWITESHDALLYSLSAGALHSMGKIKQLVSLFLPLSVFLSSGIEFFLLSVFMCFGVD